MKIIVLFILAFLTASLALGAGKTLPKKRVPSTDQGAAEKPKDPATEATPEITPPLIDTWEQEFLLSNIAMSQWFNGFAESVDLFLVGKKVSDRPNTTSVKIENSSYSAEGQSVNNVTSFNVNLRLPNLEEYWQLKFTSYDEQRDRRSVENGYLRQTPREKNYGASLGFFRKLGNIRTAFQPRLELQDPLKVSQSLSFESVSNYGALEVNPKIEFYANATIGTGVFTNLNFHRDLTKIYSLTFINEGDYQEKQHLFTANNGVSLGQLLNAKSGLSYNLFFNSNNQPSYHLQSYDFSIAYSRLIYKNILDLQFVPHANFNRDDEFRPKAGLALTFNFYF